MDEPTFIPEEGRKTYRGVPDTAFVWRGAQCDPAIDYKGYRINYWDVEDGLWSDFTELYPGHRLLSQEQVDKAFERYVSEHHYSVYEYLDSAIDNGAAEPAPDDMSFSKFVMLVKSLMEAQNATKH